MGHITKFNYSLPKTEVRISGTMRRRLDTILNSGTDLEKVPPTLVSHAIEIRHVAEGTDRSVRIPDGWFKSYKGSFAFTEDHRLTSANVESTGQVGTILSAGGKLLGTAVALGLLADQEGGTLAPTPEEQENSAYEAAHPDEARRRQELLAQRHKARHEIVSTTQAVLDDKGLNGSRINERLRMLKEAERTVAAQLVMIEAHFSSWRAKTIKEIDEGFELRVEIRDIPTTFPPDGWAQPGSRDDPGGVSSLQDLWERFGLGIRAAWSQNRKTTPTEIASDEQKIFTRRPDPLTLEVIEFKEGVPVSSKRSHHLVVDDYSVVEPFEIKKSAFGRKSLNLTFNPDGLLTGVGTEGDSAAAAAATALAQLPSDVATGIETGAKVRTGITAAQRAGLEAELARVKQEVELRQQRILQAGLDVTEADAATVERLKQLQGILEAQTAIREADPSLVAALKDSAAGDLKWYQAPVPQPPEEEKAVTVILRQGPPVDPSE